MKTVRLILFFMVAVLVSACSATDEPVCKEQLVQRSNSTANRLSVSQAERIATTLIADMSEGEETRANVNTPEVEFVLRSSKTRSLTANDTIAYVFNYPDNGGFVIISPDQYIEEPLVAYSEKGHIDINDDFVKEQIVLPLEQYLETVYTNSSTRVELPDPVIGGNLAYDVLESVSPQIMISLDQGSPWNKEVLANNENGPYVGCVPVAAALIMSRCKSSLTLNGFTYNFKEITKRIAAQQGVAVDPPISYSYELAVNLMARLLLDLGHEFEATYSPDGTGAYSYKAFNKMTSWGFISPFSGVKLNYTADILKTYIQNNHVVYVSGTRVVNGKTKGHAWVADGYEVRRTIFNFPGHYLTPVTYVHFNWGWGGRYNGYFSGSVYSPYDGCEYTASEYCPFKIEV